jgi:hypothetical protein
MIGCLAVDLWRPPLWMGFSVAPLSILAFIAFLL